MKLWVRLVSRSNSARKGDRGNTGACAVIWREGSPLLGSIGALRHQKETKNAPAGSYSPGFLSVLIAEIGKVPIEKDGEFDPWVEAAKGGAGQIVPFSALGKLALFLSD
jgi:hypothetical protein